ncbi:ATP-binding cassette domain-containing protein [Sphaerisporangium siamense]|uniref:ATP-binding cassette domain-containing protein n=1 Tax=Sphaerisporangium siamense TaxID=795645 RepID=UPI00161C7E88|nr:ATP-binding cassette domain-containing protein [Sphaerisporangium siamense]
MVAPGRRAFHPCTVSKPVKHRKNDAPPDLGPYKPRREARWATRGCACWGRDAHGRAGRVPSWKHQRPPGLFPWRTVRRNVEIGPRSRGVLRERQEEVAGVLELVGLTAFADAYPSRLSGGMAQRAALSRAQVNRPEVLLLDRVVVR